MNHDELVLWAYENAEVIATSLGKTPDPTTGLALVNRRIAEYENHYHTLKSQLAIGETCRRGAGVYVREGGYNSAEHEIAVVQAMLAPDQVRASFDPNQPPVVEIEKIIEMPVFADGPRYIDLALMVTGTKTVPAPYGYGELAAEAVYGYQLLLEIKPKITSMGDLVRQLRLYQKSSISYERHAGVYPLAYEHEHRSVCVVSPDTRFKAVIEEQGFPFVIPPLGQKSLF